METVAAWFGYGKPDPRKQRRNCLNILENAKRDLEKTRAGAAEVEKTIRKNIQKANRDLRHPSTAPQARSDLRFYGRQMVKHRNKNDRISQAFAQLESWKMMVEGDFGFQKLQNTLSVGTSVMKALNESRSDVYLAAEVQKLQTELIKADVMQGLLEDALPQNDDIEEPAVQDVIDEITEAEIDNAIASVLNQSLSTRKVRTPAPVAQEPAVEAPQEKLDEEKQDEGETAEALLEDMNHRLQALRS